MAKARKTHVRSRRHRSGVTRKHHHRRRIGGAMSKAERDKVIIPFYLLEKIGELNKRIEEKKENVDDLFEEVKEVYQLRIAGMNASDWDFVIVQTDVYDKGASKPATKDDIDKRIHNVNSFLLFWLTQRRLKAKNETVGWKMSRLFKSNDRSKKLAEAVNEFKEFYKFLKGYSQKNPQYKQLVEQNTGILKGMYGQNNNSLALPKVVNNRNIPHF